MEIATLIDALELDKSAKDRLFLSACALVGWQLMPKMLMSLYGASAESRTRLLKIKKAAASLSQAVEGLNLEYWIALNLVASELAESRKHPPSADLPTQFQLRALADAAEAACRRFRAPGRGRSADGNLLRTVRQLVRVVERATGQPVRAPKRHGGVDDPHLAGPGGDFTAGGTQLIQLLRQARPYYIPLPIPCKPER